MSNIDKYFEFCKPQKNKVDLMTKQSYLDLPKSIHESLTLNQDAQLLLTRKQQKSSKQQLFHQLNSHTSLQTRIAHEPVQTLFSYQQDISTIVDQVRLQITKEHQNEQFSQLMRQQQRYTVNHELATATMIASIQNNNLNKQQSLFLEQKILELDSYEKNAFTMHINLLQNKFNMKQHNDKYIVRQGNNSAQNKTLLIHGFQKLIATGRSSLFKQILEISPTDLNKILKQQK